MVLPTLQKKITHAVVSPGVFNFSYLNWPHPNVEMKLVDLTGKGVLIDTTCQVNKQSLMSLSVCAHSLIAFQGKMH